MASTAPGSVDIAEAPLEGVYQQLQCTEDGLTTDEATRRLGEWKRELERVPKPRQGFVAQFLSYLSNPVCWMLGGSALGLIALSSGPHHAPNWSTFLGLIILLCCNAAVGVFSERQASLAIKKLKQSPTFAEGFVQMVRVRRDGQWVEMDSAQLVAGDMISLSKNDVIPADCRLTSGRLYMSGYLQAEPSKVTGDLCLTGWRTSSGSASALVIAKGKKCLANGLPGSSLNGLPGIVARLSIFCFVLIMVFFVAEAVVLYAGFHYTYHRGVAALFVLLIGGIPIAIPALVSVALSAGVIEMANHNVLTTRLAAVEELARVTVLGVGQTALTEEQYAVADVKAYPPFTEAELRSMAAYSQSSKPATAGMSDSSFYAEWNEYYSGPAMGHPDIEILKWRALNHVDGPIQVTYRTQGSTRIKRVAKGIPGHIAENWTRNHTAAAEDQFEGDIDEFTLQGVNVLALAYEELEGDDPEAFGNGFELVGLVGFRQPLREGTEHAVADLTALGLQMKLVTTDLDLTTAKATGRRIGLGDNIFPSVAFTYESYQGQPLDELIIERNGFTSAYDVMSAYHPLVSTLVVSNFAGKHSDLASTANVSITINQFGGDFAISAPSSLPTLVEAVRISRRISWRLRACFIYACTICIRTVLCFSLLQFIYKLDFPPFMILLVALVTDMAILTLSVDHAVPTSAKPRQWDLVEILSYSAVYGVYLAFSTIFLVQLILRTHFFQRTFSLSLDAASLDSQLHMLVFLQVAQISHALLFIVRSGTLPSFCYRPSLAAIGVFCVAQTTTSIIALYANWEFAAVHSLDPKWIGVVWVWNIIWYIPLDLIKFGIGYGLRCIQKKRF
ncbi:plasma membrane ATPase [Favolaschia claudopus]|uniref:Plasma membrane ATPase n=1 Tax=Favolaschia claudopus TaxID=2862362 RepID=A0AAW0C352_9AGAR